MKKNHSVIFGITADPLHRGHEQAIISGIAYLKQLNISIHSFTLVPTYVPHLIAGKKGPVADFVHRYNMCQLAAERLSAQYDCHVSVSGVEQQLALTTGQVNYSINTINHLGLPNLLFMVSADHFQGRWPKFRKWHQWQKLLECTGLLINNRPGHVINQRFIAQLKTINSDIYIVNSDHQVDTSSTAIRANIGQAMKKQLLAVDVMDYIVEHKLYC